MTTDNKFRISILPSAQGGVDSIKPETTLQEAVTKMMMHGYSQLPVMTTQREVKGILSWKSIGTAVTLGKNPALAKDCMDTKPSILDLQDQFLKSVKQIIKEEFVLIKDQSEVICGICTLADIGSQFLSQSEPFIEVEQIELMLRDLIGEKANINDLRSTCGQERSRIINSISDLTFGEYICWFEKKENWASLELAIERTVFVDRLKSVNIIRNQLMHFRPGDIDEDGLRVLKRVSEFLRTMRKMRR